MNPGPQDGRPRRNHGAMAAPLILSYVWSLYFIFYLMKATILLTIKTKTFCCHWESIPGLAAITSAFEAIPIQPILSRIRLYWS